MKEDLDELYRFCCDTGPVVRIASVATSADNILANDMLELCGLPMYCDIAHNI